MFQHVDKSVLLFLEPGVSFLFEQLSCLTPKLESSQGLQTCRNITSLLGDSKCVSQIHFACKHLRHDSYFSFKFSIISSVNRKV